MIVALKFDETALGRNDVNESLSWGIESERVCRRYHPKENKTNVHSENHFARYLQNEGAWTIALADRINTTEWIMLSYSWP